MSIFSYEFLHLLQRAKHANYCATDKVRTLFIDDQIDEQTFIERLQAICA